MYINTNCLGSVQPQTFVSPSAFQEAVVSYWQKYVHEVLVNHLGGLSLPRKNVVKLNDCPNMTTAVKCGRKKPNYNNNHTSMTKFFYFSLKVDLILEGLPHSVKQKGSQELYPLKTW